MNTPARPGNVLADGYTVQNHLSRGNVLDVYAVWSADRDCVCIAKVLRPDRADDTVGRARLVREGRLLAELTHPHLVRGYEVITTADDSPIVVMETLTGVTLSRLIETDAPLGLDAQDVAMLGRQLCSALDYLHRHDLVHLDLKPSNIVCTGGKAILLDLSLAQPPGPCSPGAGTAEYMAPEQLTGDLVDTPADIWGLGGVLYRALTGRRPFPRQRTPRRPEHTSDLTRLDRPDVNAGLRDLVTRCLGLPAAERPTLGAVRDILDHILAEHRSNEEAQGEDVSANRRPA